MDIFKDVFGRTNDDLYCSLTENYKTCSLRVDLTFYNKLTIFTFLDTHVTDSSVISTIYILSKYGYHVCKNSCL